MTRGHSSMQSVRKGETVVMKKKHLYIWGWWQGNNLGDNWIKKILSKLFPSAEFLDTSVQKFKRGSFVICGGGGLFVYDVISPWNNLQNDISYGILGIGAEFPHKTKEAIKVWEKARFFYVRDQHSQDCMNLNNIERSYDLTFAIPLTWSERKDVNRDKVFFVWRDGQDLLSNNQFAEYIQSGSSFDEWKRILQCNFALICEDDFQTGEDNIEERISDSGFVVSGRYHGIVAAIQKGLPFVAIDICPKIRALLEECNLDEYCIKISEVDKLDGLIKKALNNIDEIREKEKQYIEKANRTLLKQIVNVRLEILKVLYPLKVIHYGSYWMKKNDVINTMSDDLSDVCSCKKIDLKVYDKYPNARIKKNMKTPNGNLCLLDESRVLRDVRKYKADVIILNSGGLYLDEIGFEKLREKNVVSVGISLSDPDVYPYNGKIYADRFDLFFTNSKYSYLNEYDHSKVNIGIMPFAASLKHHYYMPDVKRKYDVVVIAHAREDRISVIEKISKVCSVGTYGNGWKHSLGVVNGNAHVQAINSGRMYLSFAKTVAGFDNVKVGLFEAMACNQVVITSYMDELQDYFEIGREILCYKSEEELCDIISYYRVHEEEREQIRQRGYDRFLKEHTYVKRWNEVIQSVYEKKGIII